MGFGFCFLYSIMLRLALAFNCLARAGQLVGFLGGKFYDGLAIGIELGVDSPL